MEPDRRGPDSPGRRWLALSSLRHRLLLLVLLAVLPALSLIVSTAWEQRRQAAEGAKDDALRVARLASAQHERLLEGARSLLIGLAQLSDVQMHNSRACSALFAEVQRRFSLYRNIGAVRPDGQVFCTAQPLASTRDGPDRQHVQPALAAREFSVSSYRVDRSSGKAALTVSYPAVDRAGAAWAVVFAELDLGWLGPLSLRAGLPPGSIVNITDANGLVLARYPDTGDWLGKSVADSLIEAMRAQHGEGALEARGLDGTERLYAFTSLAGTTRAEPAYVTVGIPRQAALADANRLLVRNLVWAGLVILLILVAAAIASDLFILRRVGAVVWAARRLSAGDLSARAAVRGADEIGLMARAFNTMAERLQGRVKDEQEAKEQLADSTS
jgi:HAMP domain-containing protein